MHKENFVTFVKKKVKLVEREGVPSGTTMTGNSLEGSFPSNFSREYSSEVFNTSSA